MISRENTLRPEPTVPSAKDKLETVLSTLSEFEENKGDTELLWIYIWRMIEVRTRYSQYAFRLLTCLLCYILETAHRYIPDFQNMWTGLISR